MYHVSAQGVDEHMPNVHYYIIKIYIHMNVYTNITAHQSTEVILRTSWGVGGGAKKSFSLQPSCNFYIFEERKEIFLI